MLGQWGEDLACFYLSKNGFRIIARNWKCKIGEIDIVAQQKEFIVFVEVKTRLACGSSARRHIFDSLRKKKRQRLRKLAEVYALYNSWTKELTPRIDVIGVLLSPKNLTPVDVKHLIAAI